MKIVFDIAGDVQKKDVVLCEWGEAYCCIAALDGDAKALHSLCYYSFEQQDSETINTILEYAESLRDKDCKIVFCSAFPEAVLVPKKLYRNGQNFLEHLYQTTSKPLADQIGEWQIVNTYAFPALIMDAITKRFAATSFYHTYTTALKVYNGFDAANQIAVYFTPNLFRVIVKKNGQLQLAQMYHYKTALDVVYYLLKIMEECRLPTAQTAVIVSGLIEESSGLYKELHQFILNLHFAKAGDIQVKTDQPTHYFTSLHNLAACVL